MPNMLKSDFVAAIAEKTGESKKTVETVLDATWDTIGEALGAGRDLKIAGFGNFSVSERAAREGRNPATGETIQIAASKSVKFSASKALKERL